MLLFDNEFGKQLTARILLYVWLLLQIGALVKEEILWNFPSEEYNITP